MKRKLFVWFYDCMMIIRYTILYFMFLFGVITIVILMLQNHVQCIVFIITIIHTSIYIPIYIFCLLYRDMDSWMLALNSHIHIMFTSENAKITGKRLQTFYVLVSIM